MAMTEAQAAPSIASSKAPVFVLGCPRSGTTLLYHMLLSTGTFVMYPTESQVFNLLEPRFGDLRMERNRRKFLKHWTDSSLFFCTGLEATRVEEAVGDFQDAGQFLRLVMESMAEKQGAKRWAECTPDHLLSLRRIKETIPDALVIHIIRDGRDVALSLAKQHWIRPFPWDYDEELCAAALFWEWIVTQGRKHGKSLGRSYMEIHYEDLVGDPRSTLVRVGKFIGQELDYDQILQVGYGSVRRPNSSFGGDGKKGGFSPVARWKKTFSKQGLTRVENLIGMTLGSLGYGLDDACNAKNPPAALRRMRTMYHGYFSAKLLLKTRTPLGRVFGSDLKYLGLQAKGPTHAPDAMREPERIVQFSAEGFSANGSSECVNPVSEELRRRGHFSKVLTVRGKEANDASECVSAHGNADCLRKLLLYLVDGYLLNVHVNILSRRGYWLALAAGLTGRMMSRPALVTVHGALTPDHPCYERGSLSKILRTLFRVAREVACESDVVRDAIIRCGIRSEKVRILAAISSNDAGQMADWLTGDLAPEAQADIAARA